MEQYKQYEIAVKILITAADYEEAEMVSKTWAKMALYHLTVGADEVLTVDIEEV